MAQASYFDEGGNFDYKVPDSEQTACAKNGLRLRWNKEKKGSRLRATSGT